LTIISRGFSGRLVILVCIFTLIATVAGLAQASNQDSTTGELQRQLDELRSQMVKMQNRIAELEAARGIAATSSSTDPVLLQSQTAPAEDLRSQPDETKSPEEPTSFHLKGLTFTPGGFLEGTMLVRTRNENVAIEMTKDQRTLNTFYDNFGGGWGWRWGGGVGESTTTTDTYRIGTLVVDLF